MKEPRYRGPAQTEALRAQASAYPRPFDAHDRQIGIAHPAAGRTRTVFDDFLSGRGPLDLGGPVRLHNLLDGPDLR